MNNNQEHVENWLRGMLGEPPLHGNTRLILFGAFDCTWVDFNVCSKIYLTIDSIDGTTTQYISFSFWKGGGCTS